MQHKMKFVEAFYAPLTTLVLLTEEVKSLVGVVVYGALLRTTAKIDQTD